MRFCASGGYDFDVEIVVWSIGVVGFESLSIWRVFAECFFRCCECGYLKFGTFNVVILTKRSVLYDVMLEEVMRKIKCENILG